MTCYICGHKENSTVLRKGCVPLWNDAPDEKNLDVELPCVLNQCLACGHVYQPVSKSMRKSVETIYNSEFAQGVSSMGVGTWGDRRADALFFDHIDPSNSKSAMEIGCGDGYLLRRLKSKGVDRLLGIEPSVNVLSDDSEIEIHNDFLDPSKKMGEPYDLIYSIAVFEHIESIGAILEFCRNHLAENGELFFVVPDCETELATGDPALFIHQHIHYFTSQTISSLLDRHDLAPLRITALNNNLLVSAVRKLSIKKPRCLEFRDFRDYQEKLDQRLALLEKHFRRQKQIVVHGACNALNNISAWTKGKFRLADNDENKIGQYYSGMLVENPESINFDTIDLVVVLPTSYFDEICIVYNRLEYKGRIMSTEINQST